MDMAETTIARRFCSDIRHCTMLATHLGIHHLHAPTLDRYRIHLVPKLLRTEAELAAASVSM